MGLTNALQERQVVTIWQTHIPGRTDLVTEEGEPIKVIYPGRVNDDRGADFLDAVIVTGQNLIRGDVEVHVESSSWRAHHHHQDPVYNRVILHVVFRCDAKEATVLQNGQRVPTLALYPYMGNQTGNNAKNIYPSSHRPLPCRKAMKRGDNSVINEFINISGDERFLDKASVFQKAMAEEDASQSLYQGIMAALGYSKNKEPLLELSHRMPLKKLEAMTSGKSTDAEYLLHLQALLFGTAGLLPSQRSRWHLSGRPLDEWIQKLEGTWVSSGLTRHMSEGDWHMFKVRPCNFPARRISAMSYLLLRYRRKGIFEGMVDKLRDITPDSGYTELTRALTITTDGYWANHLDFGLPSRMATPALLGEGRAADIIVNALLPFTVAWARTIAQPAMVARAFSLYRQHPRLPVNTLERHMKTQLNINSCFINSARRQQGLIHIYKTMCSQGKCHTCPIGRQSTDSRLYPR